MKRVLFFLGHLDDLDIEWMMQYGNRNDLETGDRLIERGKDIDNLYIILSGKLSVSGDQKEENSIATLGAGEVVGEMSFIESRKPSVSVIAMKPSSIFSISKELIIERLENNIEFKASFYYSLALFLSNRLRKTTDQLGYGSPEEEDIIDFNILDGVSQGGSRFNQILHKFSEV